MYPPPGWWFNSGGEKRRKWCFFVLMIIETDMNRFGSHPNHGNRPLYEWPPPQGLSDTRLAGSFFEFLVTYPPHRKPRQRRWHSSYQMDRLITIPASNLNNMIFIGNITYNQFRIHCNELCSLMWYEPFIKNCYLIKSGDSKNQIQWIPDLSNLRLFYALHIKSDIVFGISLYSVTTKW